MNASYAIVGNGVAGVTAALGIRRAHPGADVHIFGAEPYPYYRRPLLWEFIAGETEQDQLFFRPRDWYAKRNIQVHLDARVTRLDPVSHQLASSDGSEVSYDRVLLATGGYPWVPPCEGATKAGVFTLRTLDDAIAIKTYAQSVSTALVIGGGLLGLETASALASAGLDVLVIETAPRLLPRQLESTGAAVLESLLASRGLQVITNARVDAILGDGRASGVQLHDGRRVDRELVLFSTGYRCALDLATQAGLAANRGIIVNEHLQTSAADVFASGDVAEFGDQVYGIIPSAVEQSQTAAANMVDAGSASYSGTLPTATLKVAGAQFTSVGQATRASDQEYDVLEHVDVATQHYRRFVLKDGRIVGATLLNDDNRARATVQLMERGTDVSGHAGQLLSDSFDMRSLVASGQ